MDVFGGEDFVDSFKWLCGVVAGLIVDYTQDLFGCTDVYFVEAVDSSVEFDGSGWGAVSLAVGFEC